MNKGTRTFIYGFFLIFLGAIIGYGGLKDFDKQSYYFSFFKIVIGVFSMWQGDKKIDKTIY